MKIEKVNENQIRCTLTREDLASRELKISELAYGTEKAKMLFRDMMQQANFEFGFEAEDIPLMIEAIPLNAECIVLIITKVEDPEELDTRFSRFAPSVTEDAEEEEDYDPSSSNEVLDLFRRLQTGRKSDTAGKDAAPASDKPEETERIFLFRIDSLRQAINASLVVKEHFQGLSTLYKEEFTGNYLLLLMQNNSAGDTFDRACNMLSEYGNLQRIHTGTGAFLAEHCEMLIKDHAIEALGGLA